MAFPVDAKVINSILSVTPSPPINKPRDASDPDANLSLVTPALPKSCAVPRVDMVIKSRSVLYGVGLLCPTDITALTPRPVFDPVPPPSS